MSLPVEPTGRAGRDGLEKLLRAARAQGVTGARLFGHVAPPGAHATERVHAVTGLVCLGGASLGSTVAAWGLGAVLASAGLRLAGLPSLGALVPRRPCWSLVLRPPAEGTRTLIAAALDRPTLAPTLPRVAFALLGLSLLSLAGPAAGRVAAALGLAALALAVSWLSKPVGPAAGTDEARAAEALLAHSLRGDRNDAAVLVGGACVDGAGVLSVLDWWGADPASTEVGLVGPLGASPAAAALVRAGWRVRVFRPDELRSLP